jgi:hypothetical protein
MILFADTVNSIRVLVRVWLLSSTTEPKKSLIVPTCAPYFDKLPQARQFNNFPTAINAPRSVTVGMDRKLITSRFVFNIFIPVVPSVYK